MFKVDKSKTASSEENNSISIKPEPAIATSANRKNARQSRSQKMLSNGSQNVAENTAELIENRLNLLVKAAERV